MAEKNLSVERKSSMTTKDLAINGLLIALVFIATKMINIPGPTEGGLIHMGNVMHFTIAIIFGRKKGALSGALGMALFDATGPWFVWTPFTFVIRFAMGYIIGYMAHLSGKQGTNFVYNLIGILIASVIMIGGYYVAEGILYGNWIQPVQSIFGNVTQCVIGAAVALPLSTILSNALKTRNIRV